MSRNEKGHQGRESCNMARNFILAGFMVCAGANAQIARLLPSDAANSGIGVAGVSPSATSGGDVSNSAVPPVSDIANVHPIYIDSKGKLVWFKSYSELPDTKQNLLGAQTYAAEIDGRTREYFGVITGKMATVPLQNEEGEINSNVLNGVGKIHSFTNNKITFEATKESVGSIKKDPAFYREPWFDSLLFHRPGPGQHRLFNLKTRRPKTSVKSGVPPLHVVGLQQGSQYLVEAHVDTHPDNLAHAGGEVVTGLFIRHIIHHIPGLKHAFPNLTWPDPEKAGKTLQKVDSNIDLGYTIDKEPERSQSRKSARLAAFAKHLDN